MPQMPVIGRRALLAGAAASPLLGVAPATAATHGVSEGGITDALVAAAQKEGMLTYYHVTSIDETGRWTAQFTKRFGVQTKNVRGPGYPTWDKWLNEVTW